MFLLELAEAVGFQPYSWSLQGSNPEALTSTLFFKDPGYKENKIK